MENHAQRPEVVEARATGHRTGAGGYSDTLEIDMLYVAVPVSHPAIAFVRMALPLTDVRQQLRGRAHARRWWRSASRSSARRVIAWVFSARIGRACG